MDPNTGNNSCGACCGSAYSSGSTTYNNAITSLKTSDCICNNGCLNECGNDDFCITGQDISTQACFDCIRTAVDPGATCAINCTGNCASYQTCFDGCPQ